MEKYQLPTGGAAGQSSIGLQIYVWDTAYQADATSETTEAKFVYLVPVTSDPPELGSAPDTIEITEADSPVRQYVSDRPDSPAVEFEYNMSSDGYNYERVKSAVSATTAKIYCILLPLGSAFLLKATGSTWMAGGNPVHGALSLAQGDKAIFVKNLTTTFGDAGIDTEIIEWLGEDNVAGTDSLSDIVAFDSMPTGRETDAVKAVLPSNDDEEDTNTETQQGN